VPGAIVGSQGIVAMRSRRNINNYAVIRILIAAEADDAKCGVLEIGIASYSQLRRDR